MLVDTPYKAQMRQAAEDALHLCRRSKKRARLHINIDKTHNEPVNLFLRIIRLDERTHARCGLIREIFVRIGKDHPVSRCPVERKIFRGSKVVDPVKMINLRTARACSLDRRVGRSRIDHDHLVSKDAHGGEPARQVLFLVLCDDTGRNFHCISSISSRTFRFSGSAASARLRYAPPSSRLPSAIQASPVS